MAYLQRRNYYDAVNAAIARRSAYLNAYARGPEDSHVQHLYRRTNGRSRSPSPARAGGRSRSPSPSGGSRRSRSRSPHFVTETDQEMTEYSDSDGSMYVRNVGMTRMKTSVKAHGVSIRVVGVMGCSAIFLFGKDTAFISSAHAAPTELQGRAQKIGKQAQDHGQVDRIHIASPDEDDYKMVEKVLKKMFPDARFEKDIYPMKDGGDYEFTTSFNRPVVVRKYNPEE